MLCLLAAGLGVYLAGRPEQAQVPSVQRHRPGPPVSSRQSAASELFDQLLTRLQRGSRSQVLALAAPGVPSARKELAALYDNVRSLGLEDLSLRYVDEDAGALPAGQERRLHGRGWVADVQLGWRLPTYDASVNHLETTLTLTKTAKGAAFVSARGDYGDAAPLWLLDRLHVRRGDRWLVMTTRRADVPRFAGLAEHAVADVDKVLRGWTGRLVVEVPSDQQELDRTLDADAHTYDEIAAVTTTSDGSLRRRAATHIFVNPRVFDPLGPHGSQIVMSHEATHVATGAATVSMPTWLLEGFADYVALDHVHLPVSVTASQILAQVRKDGPPSHLPGKTEFDTANTALGASYESAWLACRLIGEKYGEQRLIAFYRQSERDSSTDAAFRQVLDTSEAAFTAQWQDYLRRLAG